MVKPIGSSDREEDRSLSPRNDQSSSSSSKYKGVRKRKWGKWVSEIRLPNSRERIWLGSYDSAEKAARAFDAALFCLRGNNAKFNFPGSPPQIPDGRSLSPLEIQLAASRFANESATAENNPSPCVSWSAVSDGTVQMEGSLGERVALEDSETQPFMDLLTSMDSGNLAADYGIFPGFDELSYGFVSPPPDQVPGGGADYSGEEGDVGQDYNYSNCLWNF